MDAGAVMPPEYFPSAQIEHAVEAAVEDLPVPQAVHVSALVLVVSATLAEVSSVPAGQLLQMFDSALAQYCPAVQVVVPQETRVWPTVPRKKVST